MIASDRPIPPAGGARFLHDCEGLLERSPLKAQRRQYRLYVTNADWRHRLFFLPNPPAWGLAYAFPWGGNVFLSGADFETGRVMHWGYQGTPPRTLAALCAHELTHIIIGEHVGLMRPPEWVWEGLSDYVGIENRQSFEELRDALDDRPVDDGIRQRYGFYPRCRLLVTYFIEKKEWTARSTDRKAEPRRPPPWASASPPSWRRCGVGLLHRLGPGACRFSQRIERLDRALALAATHPEPTVDAVDAMPGYRMHPWGRTFTRRLGAASGTEILLRRSETGSRLISDASRPVSTTSLSTRRAMCSGRPVMREASPRSNSPTSRPAQGGVPLAAYGCRCAPRTHEFGAPDYRDRSGSP
jgi:hypothetical protein